VRTLRPPQLLSILPPSTHVFLSSSMYVCLCVVSLLLFLLNCVATVLLLLLVMSMLRVHSSSKRASVLVCAIGCVVFSSGADDAGRLAAGFDCLSCLGCGGCVGVAACMPYAPPIVHK